MKSMGLILLFFAVLFAGCSLFEGTSNVAVISQSDKSLSSWSVADVTGSTSNLTLFAPEAFRVEIKTVKIRRGVWDSWVTLYDSSKWGDIVPGIDVVPVSGQVNVPAGSYEAVLITYNPNWNLTLNWLPYLTNYQHTNTDASTARTLIWITESLETDAKKLYPNATFNRLTAGIKVERDKNYTINMKFKTKNMILVWTNGSSNVTGSQVVVPDLTFTALPR